MELRFDAMLCFNLGNENSDAGHIKFSCGPQVLHPWFFTYLFRRWVVRIYQVHMSTEDASLPGVVMAYKFLKYPKSNALWIILTDKYSTIEQQKR